MFKKSERFSKRFSNDFERSDPKKKFVKFEINQFLNSYRSEIPSVGICSLVFRLSKSKSILYYFCRCRTGSTGQVARWVFVKQNTKSKMGNCITNGGFVIRTGQVARWVFVGQTLYLSSPYIGRRRSTDTYSKMGHCLTIWTDSKMGVCNTNSSRSYQSELPEEDRISLPRFY